MKAQEKIYRVDNKVDVLAAKVDAFIEEIRDFKQEMRDKDKKREEEIKESRAEMATIGRHVRNITIAAMVGIGALALSGGAIAVAVIYSVLTK